MNVIFDNNAAVQLAFRRSSNTDQSSYEKIGYGTGAYDGSKSVDFGEKGCMTGFNLYWGAPAGRLLSDERFLNENPAELVGADAVANPKLNDAVA